MSCMVCDGVPRLFATCNGCGRWPSPPDEVTKYADCITCGHLRTLTGNCPRCGRKGTPTQTRSERIAANLAPIQEHAMPKANQHANTTPNTTETTNQETPMTTDTTAAPKSLRDELAETKAEAKVGVPKPAPTTTRKPKVAGEELRHAQVRILLALEASPGLVTKAMLAELADVHPNMVWNHVGSQNATSNESSEKRTGIRSLVTRGMAYCHVSELEPGIKELGYGITDEGRKYLEAHRAASAK